MVNGASKNKQNAYNFLKVLVSPEVQGVIDASPLNAVRISQIPLSNKALDMILDELKPVGALDQPSYGGLPQSFIDDYKAIIADIDSVYQKSPIELMIREEFAQYWDGTLDIDACFDNLQSKLEIYISE